MIENIKFSNFYSFAEEAEISLVVNKKPSPSYFDIDLANGVRLNKVVSIIGPNGSGKTTLIKLIGGLLKSEKGTILLDDNCINSLNSKQLSKR